MAGRRRARTSTDPLNLLPDCREQARAVVAIAGPVLERVNVRTEHGPNTARTQRRVVGACATADVQHQVTWLRVEMIEYPVEKVIGTLAVALVRLQPDAASVTNAQGAIKRLRWLLSIQQRSIVLQPDCLQPHERHCGEVVALRLRPGLRACRAQLRARCP